MKTISANMNVMIMACEKASKSLIRDFGEIEKLQVSIKGTTFAGLYMLSFYNFPKVVIMF